MIKLGRYELTQVGNDVMIKCNDGICSTTGILSDDKILDPIISKLARLPQAIECAELFTKVLDGEEDYRLYSILNSYNLYQPGNRDFSAKSMFKIQLDAFVDAFNKTYSSKLVSDEVSCHLGGLLFEPFPQ